MQTKHYSIVSTEHRHTSVAVCLSSANLRNIPVQTGAEGHRFTLHHCVRDVRSYTRQVEGSSLT